MAKKIPVGIEFYKEMIGKDYYYVDKTLLIKELLDAGVKVSLFTRPRRFGKTLALSMLKTFFEDERDRDGNRIENGHYFAEKKIVDCGEEYLARQGKYPVISLTLKSAKQPSYEMAYEILRQNIADEFRRHQYVCGQNILEADEIKRYQDIITRKAQESDYAVSLAFLSQCLQKYHNKNVIILIDEYDVPLENAYFRGFYNRMIDFIRSMFESALKTNNVLEFAVITGCLRVSKESIFTGLNNLDVVSVLRNDYAEAFGFTPPQVRALLAEYGMEARVEEVKDWYDGYLFGNTEVYNPWSIISYVNENRNKKDFFPKPYWANTSSNSIIRELIEKSGVTVRAEIEQLVNGGTIKKPVHEDVTYADIHESEDNLWNFLFFTGYLKKIEESMEGDQIFLQMAIPNREIRSIYRRTFISWFDESVRKADWIKFYKALLAADCAVMEAMLKKQLTTSISFHDEAEQFYHGFMAGVLSGMDGYDMLSNREAGNGRPDILMNPHDDKGSVLIFEFKKADKFGQMDKLCDDALEQIEIKQYDAESRELGYGNFIKYGICFCKKTCRVKAVRQGAEFISAQSGAALEICN